MDIYTHVKGREKRTSPGTAATSGKLLINNGYIHEKEKDRREKKKKNILAEELCMCGS